MASTVVRPDSAPPLSEPPAAEYKFPIETYASLDQATAERIAKFEGLFEPTVVAVASVAVPC